MVSPLVLQLGLPFLLQVVGGALAQIDSPAARSASDAINRVQDAVMAGRISAEQIAEANRHAEAMAQAESAERQAMSGQVNDTYRTEIASDDKYVRRMRPTFGYLMAATWTMQMSGIAYVMTFRPQDAPGILAVMDSLAVIWAMGLSVLGIYVYKRSEDKKLPRAVLALPGMQPPGSPPATPPARSIDARVSRQQGASNFNP